MPTQPDITSPVTRGRNASVGTTMNYGTSQGEGSIGNINNSKGGVADNGTTSFQNVPNNQVYTHAEGNGGASKATTASSNNPVAIQADSVNDRTSEYVARTTSGSVNAAGAGNYASIPRSDVVVNMPVVDPGAVKINSASLVGQVYQNNPHFGENLSAGSTNNLQRMAQDFSDTQQDPNKKINGAKPIGDPTPQDRNDIGYFIDSNLSTLTP